MADPIPTRPRSAVRKRKTGIPAARPEPDPLGDVVYTGDLEVDARAELDALHAAFKDRRRREDRRFKQATDSEYWVALCFEDREQKERFLDAFRVAQFGDKYLDGRLVARSLGVSVEENNDK